MEGSRVLPCRIQLNCLAGVEYLLCSDFLLLTPGQPGLYHPCGQEGLLGSLPTMQSLTLEPLPNPHDGELAPACLFNWAALIKGLAMETSFSQAACPDLMSGYFLPFPKSPFTVTSSPLTLSLVLILLTPLLVDLTVSATLLRLKPASNIPTASLGPHNLG